MNVTLVTPAPPGSRTGNRVTALRWAKRLGELGHRVRVTETYDGRPCGLLVALHARRSFPSVRAYREKAPGGPLVVALTGTDLYQDLPENADARRSLDLADRVVALHPLAGERLTPAHAAKVFPILQSALPPPPGARRATRGFPICVVGHLRPEKDPFQAALAARGLPAASRVRVLHAGGALTPDMAVAAREEQAGNPRYRWLSDLPHWRVRRLLGTCRALVLSSLVEGGANVISEAAVAGLPVLASRIHSSEGLLGRNYPAFFPVGGTAALAALMLRAEREPAFLAGLAETMAALAPSFTPEREREAWRELLQGLG